jgi:hypothetical protein
MLAIPIGAGFALSGLLAINMLFPLGGPDPIAFAGGLADHQVMPVVAVLIGWLVVCAIATYLSAASMVRSLQARGPLGVRTVRAVAWASTAILLAYPIPLGVLQIARDDHPGSATVVGIGIVIVAILVAVTVAIWGTVAAARQKSRATS